MRKVEELTEVEIELRALIYAVETKDMHNPNHPIPLGEAFLSHILERAKETAKKLGIPLTDPLSNHK
jgi:hypothetical protein